MTIQSISTDKPLVCSSCGHSNPGWRSFCEECERSLRAEAYSTRSTTVADSKTRPWWQWLRLVGAILVLVRVVISCAAPPAPPQADWLNTETLANTPVIVLSAMPVASEFYTPTQVFRDNVITLDYPRTWRVKASSEDVVLVSALGTFQLSWYSAHQKTAAMDKSTRNRDILVRRTLLENDLRARLTKDGATLFSLTRFDDPSIGKFQVFTGIYEALVMQKDFTFMHYVMFDVVCGYERVCTVDYSHKGVSGGLSPREGAMLTQLINSVKFFDQLPKSPITLFERQTLSA